MCPILSIVSAGFAFFQQDGLPIDYFECRLCPLARTTVNFAYLDQYTIFKIIIRCDFGTFQKDYVYNINLLLTAVVYLHYNQL